MFDNFSMQYVRISTTTRRKVKKKDGSNYISFDASQKGLKTHVSVFRNVDSVRVYSGSKLTANSSKSRTQGSMYILKVLHGNSRLNTARLFRVKLCVNGR